MVAAFLNSFSDVLGMAPPPSADQIAQAVHDGQDSLLLGAIHISMLRLVQADMEEAHASGAASVSAAGPGSAGHHFDRAMISAAHMLEGCWGWGYDMDSWRAHLNALTWPEVLRQLAVVGTSGSPRQKQGRGRRPSNVHKAKMGVEGEDVVEDEQGNLKLRLPNRLGIGTVKAASWQVLAEVGPEGLPIAEMAHRIHESGLRDFKYTKQPEATVAGALARDVLFTRVGPAQYALSSIIKHKLNATSAQDGAGPEGKTEGMDVDEHDGQRANQQQGAPEGTEEGDSGGEDDDDEGGNEDRGGTGEGGRPGASQPKAPWVGILAASDYDALNVGERLAALAWLIHTVCDSPTVRLLLDARVDQAINDKKEIVEMGKEIKKKRLEDAYVKSRAAADVASKKMAELQAVGGSLPGYPPPAAMPLNFDPQLAGAASAAAQRAMEDAAVAARLVSEVAKDDSEEEKLAHQRRMDALARVDEETAIQLQPLGMDRRYNRYWRVAPVGCDSGEVALGAQDPGIGRVFVEAADGSSWRLIQQPEQLDGLSAALDPRGAREGGLAAALNRLGPAIKRAMPSSPLTVDLRGASTSGPACPGAGPLQQHQQQHLARQLRFVRPQATLFPASAEVKPLVGEPVRPSKLKEDVLRIGAALPEPALHFDFDRAAWQQAVLQASNPLALRQCVGRLEASVVPDYLSAAYNRNPQILKAAWSSAQRQQQEAEALVATSAEGAPSEADQQLAMEEPLSWLPPTYAAVALRLQALDAALYFAPQTRCGRDRLAGYRYILRPAPVPRPTALEQLRQQMQQQQQQQQHPEQQQNQQQQQQGEGIASRCDVLTSGMVPLAYGGTLTAHGRLKPALFFPELPLAYMSQDQQRMHLPLEQLRAAVAEAAAAGSLVPPTHASAADGAAAAAAAAGEGRGGRSAAAAHDAIQAQKCERKDAMVRASAAVRSLASRVASARGSSKHDKFAKARSHKAKKVRQSNLSKQLAREKGGIGSEEEGPDYGEGYDDGFEEMDMLGGENANGE
ncbi:hypothetical protein DUNSADRAFT_8371 [Dunaliella salina]|nr:hypothetical protein DUNSADRAFT_8371 [Dunaliella salina]|eukprot:KAF5834831.1 hypothetical protein DUNSADRAFT_8371 [Dunaliella salina]